MLRMMWNYGTRPSQSRYEMAITKDPNFEAAAFRFQLMQILNSSCFEHSGPGFGFQFAHDSYWYG